MQKITAVHSCHLSSLLVTTYNLLFLEFFMGGVTITLNCDCHRKIKSVLQFPQLLLPTTLSAPFQNSLHASYLHFYVQCCQNFLSKNPNLGYQKSPLIPTKFFLKNPHIWQNNPHFYSKIPTV